MTFSHQPVFDVPRTSTFALHLDQIWHYLQIRIENKNWIKLKTEKQQKYTAAKTKQNKTKLAAVTICQYLAPA